MNGRDDLRDALGALALGVLPAADAASVLEAIRGDDDLRAEFLELRAAADAVGSSAEATHAEFDELAAARLRRRLLTAVRTPDEVDLTVPEVIAKRAAHPWLAYGVAAAAIVIATASYASYSSLELQIAADHAALAKAQAETTAALNRDRDRVASASEERRDVEAILSEHARHFPIAHGDVVSTQGRLYLALTKLRTLPAGRVYQAWTIAPGHAPIPGKTFVPEGDVTVVALGAPAAGVTTVALTVEPKGGSTKPSTTPAFVRRLD